MNSPLLDEGSALLSDAGTPPGPPEDPEDGIELVMVAGRSDTAPEQASQARAPAACRLQGRAEVSASLHHVQRVSETAAWVWVTRKPVSRALTGAGLVLSVTCVLCKFSYEFPGATAMTHRSLCGWSNRSLLSPCSGGRKSETQASVGLGPSRLWGSVWSGPGPGCCCFLGLQTHPPSLPSCLHGVPPVWESVHSTPPPRTRGHGLRAHPNK